MSDNRTYIAIDLKSFYASVECVERGLDPLTTNLVVADASRTEKTICLAVTPALKSFKISGRARLFEVVQRVAEVNAERRLNAPDHVFTRTSYNLPELQADPSLQLDYIVAPPRMGLYMDVSTRVYNVYLQYVAPEDMHIYSVDEVFIDATDYLKTYHMTARELTEKMIHEVLLTTGVTATAGIAPNMYLCKIAMDIVAKHIPADENGVRIAEIDEMSYREKLWGHRPLTDFWRIGRGTARKLEQYGMMTLGDVARCSIGGPNDYYNEELLYKLFGIQAEFLIDHAWGYEPCRIADVKAVRPQNNSLSTGQVLSSPYTAPKGKMIVREMTDLLVLDLVEKGLMADQMVLTVCYDNENLQKPEIAKQYRGPVVPDPYGRGMVPKPAHGSANLGRFTSSTKLIMDTVMELYDRIVIPYMTVRRMSVCANHVIPEYQVQRKEENSFEQLELFVDYDEKKAKEAKEREEEQKEKSLQHAMLDIKKKYGKNAILKGTNLQEGATSISRNGQIGGHKA